MDEAKPRVEIASETKEELHLMDLDRKPRAQKSAAESTWFDGTHEIRLTERAFKPRHGAAIDEIRAFVDALEVRKRDLPPLPEPPARADVAPVPAVPDHYRAPLEAAIEGVLVNVETVHRVGTGTVVDVQWEDKEGALRKGLFLVEDGAARPYDDVASRIDALPTPEAPAPGPAPAPASVEGAAPKKKGMLSFGRSKAKPEAAAADDKPKKRFGFGKK